MTHVAARRSISAVVALCEEWATNADSITPDDARRIARCVVILLTAHVDAHLTDKEQDSD